MNNIRQLRKAQGMTQAELARRLDEPEALFERYLNVICAGFQVVHEAALLLLLR